MYKHYSCCLGDCYFLLWTHHWKIWKKTPSNLRNDHLHFHNGLLILHPKLWFIHYIQTYICNHLHIRIFNITWTNNLALYCWHSSIVRCVDLYYVQSGICLWYCFFFPFCEKYDFSVYNVHGFLLYWTCVSDDFYCRKQKQIYGGHLERYGNQRQKTQRSSSSWGLGFICNRN